MFHTILIAGYVGRDPELRYAPDGKAVTDFSVAVKDGFGESEKTIWFKVTAWDKKAETCAEFLKKGAKVLVEGRLKANKYGCPNAWQGENGVRSSFEVTASIVRFLSSKDEMDAMVEEEGASEAEQADIPF